MSKLIGIVVCFGIGCTLVHHFIRSYHIAHQLSSGPPQTLEGGVEIGTHPTTRAPQRKKSSAALSSQQEKEQEQQSLLLLSQQQQQQEEQEEDGDDPDTTIISKTATKGVLWGKKTMEPKIEIYKTGNNNNTTTTTQALRDKYLKFSRRTRASKTRTTTHSRQEAVQPPPPPPDFSRASKLEPCRVLIMNSSPWHSEILESIAKLLPLSTLGLFDQQECNPYHLIFDYKLKHRSHNVRLPRSKLWVDQYFNKYLKNTKTVTTTNITTNAEGGGLIEVVREIRSASLLDMDRHEKRHMARVSQAAKAKAAAKSNADDEDDNEEEEEEEEATKEHVWQRKRGSYTNKDSDGKLYHSVVEGTCYCQSVAPGGTKETRQKAWLADWMLEAPMAVNGTGQARTCIFHEACPAKYNTPQGIWVSPHVDNYFIPWALPFAETTNVTTTTVTTSTTTRKPPNYKSPPVICSVGNTARRHFSYVGQYLKEYFKYENSSQKSNKQKLPKVQFQILGQGTFPLLEKYRKYVKHYDEIVDDVQFARLIKQSCDALMVLVHPRTHPDYFKTSGSQFKLSGSIPPIFAYRKPYVLHQELMDLYGNDLKPLNLPHGTFSNKMNSFIPAITKLVQEMELEMQQQQQ